MNKKHLIFAGGYGALWGFFMMNVIWPRQESVIIHPKSEGGYEESVGKDFHRVQVTEYENGALEVSIDPIRNRGYYLAVALLAFFFGSRQYQQLKKGPEKVVVEDDGYSPSLNHPPSEDPLYEEFLQEDDNRRLFPRPHLEEEFQSWVLTRDSSDEKQV